MKVFNATFSPQQWPIDGMVYMPHSERDAEKRVSLNLRRGTDFSLSWKHMCLP